ncbi:MAG TPA: glutamate-1-semialdehyde 2,1-aminomutase [Haliscomenobacter sp.]|uniref:glutamate-1-semialdehyde 2,1-aminomutase n=1 Tax=Haliscomenobacter sp. TaxID=2717303 RepID=UPI002C86580D|nr:glutamate-1-semialdehyde 2,1-aminomutase [Haliscomenobacter sp.]HOY18046.1 glutamate-1-semialdehyde 2,1-aminomutase [Haliscomenobacter sp.]HPH18600.1 glutamate-1-semialdehyde 2,1-aminomutase [Haliscomenobacter sp.]
MKDRNFDKSLELKKRIHQLIPGGCHTYAKGDDQFPEFHPPYLTRGEGCRVWDVDGNEYIEYGMGLRAVALGHGYPAVVTAACQQMWKGINFARPATIELEAAETFLKVVPGAEMVKFAKNGSDATTAALKLARAYTGRDMVAICADHPFFSVDDWFIGSTAINAGIPQCVQDLTVGFKFNDLESVESLFERYPDQIAGLIMEVEKNDPVDLHFLRAVQELCKTNGSLFILDEMITGFRWHIGGAQTLYNIVPDLSTFGKAMGNGFAISALAGKREIMELGGLYHDQERVFLLSTTHGAENHALAAFIAVVKEYEEKDIIGHLQTQGERLRVGLEQSINTHGLQDYVGIHGFPVCLVYSTKNQLKQASQPFRTLLLQELIKRGVIAPSLVLSYAHKAADIDQTVAIFHAALEVYRRAIDEGIDKYLEGESVQPVYRKRNHQSVLRYAPSHVGYNWLKYISPWP